MVGIYEDLQMKARVATLERGNEKHVTDLGYQIWGGVRGKQDLID